MMRTYPVVLVLLLLVSAPAFAVEHNATQHLIDRILPPGEAGDDAPLRRTEAGIRGDTTWYGQYEVIGSRYYAIPFGNKIEGSWTFDRGAGPIDPPPPVIHNGEGWLALDRSQNQETYFRVIDGGLDLGPGVPSPIIAGEQSLWVGADKRQSDSLCWHCGAGYGNDWGQRVISPDLAYDGSGDVTLSFDYWSLTEECFDGTQVYLKRADDSELMLNPYPAGTCDANPTYIGGTFTDSIGHYSCPAPYARVITAVEVGGPQDIRIVFEFSSDGGWSDEDCDFTSIWGPFGVDDVSVVGGGIDAAYDFEDGLQGWIPAPTPGFGSYTGIADINDYTLVDPCYCRLSGNIIEMHAGEGNDGYHPATGQWERLQSPICGLANPGPNEIFLELDLYGWAPPGSECTLLRTGWHYYPWICHVTGEAGWSPRVGQSAYWMIQPELGCDTFRFPGTGEGNVPSDAEKVIALIDVMFDSDAFMIPCDGDYFSPLFDNLTVATVPVTAVAPAIDFDVGTAYQDVGSYPSDLFDPMAPGPANITRDLNFDDPSTRDYCGDSLVVVGPQPTSDPNTRWEARLWWRVAKRAPLQADYENGTESRYKIWKDRVSDGHQIDRPENPEFAGALMDSSEIGFVVPRNKFCSVFGEDDDDFAGEGNPENEILWDDIFYPGTQVQYFITSNYTVTPNEFFYLPDTSGGYFYEFEILPGLRTAYLPDCGGLNHDQCVFQPATLYIDAYNRGAQAYIENALRTILNGLEPCLDEMGCEIPRDRAWDRYDYELTLMTANAPFMRGPVGNSNNGMTLGQILGYRTILLNTGHFGEHAMQDIDFLLFNQWLTSPECSANLNRQVFIMNGDRCGDILRNPGDYPDVHGPAFLSDRLGAALFCDAFHGYTDDPDCGAENTSYCVRLLPVAGGAFDTELDIDAWGSYCPNLYSFNAYSEDGGTGNRTYYAEDGLKEMDFAQITNENLATDANYRTVISSPSWHRMTARDAGGSGMDLCPRDLPSIVAAEIGEIGAALKWGFDVADHESIPKLSSAQKLADCQDTWDTIPSDVGEPMALRVNRLYQNEPNPFNPTTTIRFRLANAGEVQITIYDVNGRLVRTLIDGKKDAGLHKIQWDGTDDTGRAAGSGVYWSRMKTGPFVSNRKLVILK